MKAVLLELDPLLVEGYPYRILDWTVSLTPCCQLQKKEFTTYSLCSRLRIETRVVWKDALFNWQQMNVCTLTYMHSKCVGLVICNDL
jgi:hypothetical protein